MLSLVQSVKEKGSAQDHGPWLMVFENSLDYTVLVGQYQGMGEFLRVGGGGESGNTWIHSYALYYWQQVITLSCKEGGGRGGGAAGSVVVGRLFKVYSYSPGFMVFLWP